MPIEIYSDGASLPQIQAMSLDNRISGFTTNPTLMRKAGVTDYMGFARRAVELVESKPISFEVIGDEFSEMNRQARVLSELGANVFVKIPVINSEGASSVPLIKALLSDGVPVNVTAVFTEKQIDECVESGDNCDGRDEPDFCLLESLDDPKVKIQSNHLFNSKA
jgi:transaldolase